jgi:hypothetical protein
VDLAAAVEYDVLLREHPGELQGDHARANSVAGSACSVERLQIEETYQGAVRDDKNNTDPKPKPPRARIPARTKRDQDHGRSAQEREQRQNRCHSESGAGVSGAPFYPRAESEGLHCAADLKVAER